MSFQPPEHLIVKQTEHWTVNHRTDSELAGYLMVGARLDTNRLFDLPPDAFAELGPLLAWVEKAVADLFHPEHIYMGRYGHQKGHSIHFHVIPVYSWVKAAFTSDSKYGVLKSFHTPGASNSEYDGAELTLYGWREFCESTNPPPSQGPSVTEAVRLLRERLATSN